MAVVAACIVLLAITFERSTYHVWGAFIVGPVLLLSCIPMATRAARYTADPRIGRLVLFGAFAKIIGGALVRFWIDVELYGGTADSTRYHQIGAELAPHFRSGIYENLGEVSSTRFAEILTGQVYVFTGSSRLAGFMVFSWLAFVGCYLAWRAACIAVPSIDSRRYLVLIAFYPTMLVWSSGTGKDAWMVLCLGAASYGLARLLTGRTRGLIPLGLGLWGAVVMRPHVALIFVVGAAIAVPIRYTTGRAGHRRPIATAATIVAMLVAAVLVVSQAEDFFALDELDVESAEQVTESVQTQTSIGESNFESADPDNPVGYLIAAVTVLFRPFPFEVDNVQALLTAVEGLLLAGVIVVSSRHLTVLPRAVLRVPYVAFALGYAAAFVYAFAAIENFGILARQRTQVLPFVFVLLALGRTTEVESKDKTSNQTGHSRSDCSAAIRR